jgi:hypothetical protein
MNKLPNLKAEWVERIFMVLHGRFGNTFFNKYKIGQINADGEDAGLVNARATWSSELAGISAERLKAGLESSYEHAPSCDDFKARCKAHVKHEDYKALSAPVDREANKRYADNVVKFVANNLVEKTDFLSWAKRIIANPENFPPESLVKAKEAMKVSA